MHDRYFKFHGKNFADDFSHAEETYVDVQSAHSQFEQLTFSAPGQQANAAPPSPGVCRVG